MQQSLSTQHSSGTTGANNLRHSALPLHSLALQAKRKRKRKTDFLSRELISEYIHYSQAEAAEKLGISVSSLKRRFYELNLGLRWPSSRSHDPGRQSVSTTTTPITTDYITDGISAIATREEERENLISPQKMSVHKTLVHATNVPEKQLDSRTLVEISMAFACTDPLTSQQEEFCNALTSQDSVL